MVEATITTKANLYDHDPGKETVVLTVSDGETYKSRRFKKIVAAQATGNEDVEAYLTVTFTGQVATINYVGQTDKLVTLTLWGRK